MFQPLTRAFATHLHSDHTLGLADLILTPWILERPTPLSLYGPRGLRAMTDHLIAAYAEDIRIRTRGGEPSSLKAAQISVPGMYSPCDQVTSSLVVSDDSSSGGST